MNYSRIINLFHQASQTLSTASPLKDRIILLDGGLGEELLNHGVPYDAKIWSARALVDSEYHTMVQKVHTLFIEAGAQCITTNSYGIVPGVGFTDHGDISEYARIAGLLARAAVKEGSTKGEDRFVLGSLGPLVESYRPDRILSRKEGVAYYTTLIRALQPYVDAFIAETLSTTEEARQVIDAVGKGDHAQLFIPPLLISFTLQSNGLLRSQETVVEALSTLLDYWETHTPNIPLLALLFNCSEPEAITKALDAICKSDTLPQRLRSHQILLGAYANRLTPIQDHVATGTPQPLRTDVTPSQYSHDYIQIWINEYNVQVVGGCCGISPQHIAFIHALLLQNKGSPALSDTKD